MGAPQKRVASLMKKGKTMSEAWKIVKGRSRSNPKRRHTSKRRKNPKRKTARKVKHVKRVKKHRARKVRATKRSRRPKTSDVTTITHKKTIRNPRRSRRHTRRHTRRNPVAGVLKGSYLPSLKKNTEGRGKYGLKDIAGGVVGGIGGLGVSGITKIATGKDWAGTLVHGVYCLGGSMALNQMKATKPYARGFFIGSAISLTADVIATVYRAFTGMADDDITLGDLGALPKMDQFKTVLMKGAANIQKIVPGLGLSADVWDSGLYDEAGGDNMDADLVTENMLLQDAIDKMDAGEQVDLSDLGLVGIDNMSGSNQDMPGLV